MTPLMQQQSAGSRGFRHISVGMFLAMLLLFVIATPFQQGLGYGDLITSALLALIMASGVVMIGASRSTLTLATILAVATILAKWVNHFRPELLPASIYLFGGVLF